MTREERDSQERKLADRLIKVEQAYVRGNKPPYSSTHEAYAVIREEALEVVGETQKLNDRLQMLEDGVYVHESPEGIKKRAQCLEDVAIAGLIECVHTAAAARKLSGAITRGELQA